MANGDFVDVGNMASRDDKRASHEGGSSGSRREEEDDGKRQRDRGGSNFALRLLASKKRRYHLSQKFSLEDGRNAGDASWTDALSVLGVFGSGQSLAMSSGSPFLGASAAANRASPVPAPAPALVASSDGHSSQLIPPLSVGQAGLTAPSSSSLSFELSTLLPSPPQGRLAEGSPCHAQGIDVTGPSGSRAPTIPPPAHLGRPSYYDEAFETEMDRAKRVWYQTDFNASYSKDFVFHQRSALNFAFSALVASRLAHSGEQRTHIKISEMERRLARQFFEHKKQLKTEEAEIAVAYKKVDELLGVIGGLCEEKYKAELGLSSLQAESELLKAEVALSEGRAKSLEDDVRSTRSEMEALKEMVEAKRKAAEGARIEAEEFKMLAEGVVFDGIRCV